MALTLPAWMNRNRKSGSTATTVMDSASAGPSAAWSTRLPVIGGKPLAEQRNVLLVLLALFAAVGATLIWQDFRNAQHGVAYASATGQMRMLSQRLAKAAQMSLQGETGTFRELADSRDQFAGLLGKLKDGGDIDGVSVPGSPAGAQTALEALATEWDKTLKNASAVVAQESSLVALGRAVDRINARNPQLLEQSEQLAAQKLAQGGAREIAAANQLVMLSQRIAKNANALRVADAIDPEVTFLLGKDMNTFRELLTGLAKGSEALRLAAAGDAETRQKLAELETTFKDYEDATSGILGNLQNLAQAKLAGSRILRDSGPLLGATDALAKAYQEQLGSRAGARIVILVVSLLGVACIVLLTRIYNDDARRGQLEAERRETEARRDKEGTQTAILRLMNEMGDLADGDLTIRATVSEDITGAIADSVNYTVEELAVLVRRINDAASRVASATEVAKRTSAELLATSEQQAQQLQQAGSSALAMAQSMGEMSQEAMRSAQVARQSLSAAQNGSEAVSNSIRGMNEIREQIQETSKRIKRLGESSQEIGEIVELISDITEQTNVLALNAAIQAASAGEAGRGFTVVAEEVQRLAERSAEATKQIAAIVKTIQTDTADAVAAMESSTRGVVEGAKLSDAAGQALAEISAVSQQLAELIQNMSGSSELQAQAATRVASAMQDILKLTERSTQTTQQTAQSIGALTELAVELKGSVSGFKV